MIHSPSKLEQLGHIYAPQRWKVKFLLNILKLYLIIISEKSH